MLTRKSDSILLLVAFTLIIWSLLLLYSRSSSNLDGVEIGKIIESSLQVRSRQSKSLTWKDINGGSGVVVDQYVFTGERARAKIQLSDGPLIDVSEKTLIKLHDPDKKFLTVEKGIIRAFVSDDKSLEVDLGGKIVSISGKNAEVVMQIQNGQGDITVSSGEADLKVDDKTKKLNTKEIVSISQDPQKEILVTEKINLLNPESNLSFYQSGSSRRVEFSWELESSAEIEISQDPEFKKVIVKSGAIKSFEKDLKSGHYYWRVKNENAKSQTSQFTIITETAPEILSPQPNEIIRVVDYAGNESISLNWKETDGPFDLELKNAEGLTSVQKVYPPYDYPVTKTEVIEWRLKKNLVGRDETVWSPWQKNQLIYIPKPVKVVDLLPDNYEQITYGEEAEHVILEWKDTLAPYEIEIKNGQNIERIQSPKNKHEYILKTQGEYQWRVRTVDQYERESEFSEWQSFSWKDESASLNDSAQKIVLKRPSQKVNFSWEDPQESEVRFELSKDQQFSDVVITKKLKTDSTEVTFPDQGTYYWRTQKVQSGGSIKFSKPKKVIIEPAPAPEKPENLPEVEVPLEFIESTQTKSFLDYFIPSAYADEMKLGAPLSWPKKEDAEFYLIEIFSDPEGRDKVHEVKTAQTNYRWENAKIGEYYWRWAVIDYWGRVSPFSDLSILKLVPPQNFKLEKAKLISPVRKKEILINSPILFQWSEIKETENYVFEVSDEDDFDTSIEKKVLKKNEYSLERKLTTGDYFWRVLTQKWDQKRESSTGRFSIVEPVKPKPVMKEIPQERNFVLPSSLLIISWAPSIDSLNFETDDSEGDVSGNVLVGFKAEYQKQFHPKWRLEASILHQSGKVFDDEAYKFRRTQVGASRKISEKITIAPSISLVEFQKYSNNTGKLKASDQRSFDVGAELRYELNYVESKWDILGTLRAGGVTSYGVGARRFSGKWTQGIFAEKRIYDESSFEGDQTSLRLEIGRLFSFD